MSNLEVKKIASREEAFLQGYEYFAYIEDKYILGNGILIDKNGKVLWSKPWQHSYFTSIYIRDKRVLITDRFAMPGPITTSLGICCIDMKTGDYIWRHWYDNRQEERFLFMYGDIKSDINLVGRINFIESNNEFINCGNFRIKIDDGSYDCIKDCDEKKIKKSILAEGPQVVERYNSPYQAKNSIVNFGITNVLISGIEFTKENYFFNKCNAVIEKSNNIYFFGVPAKRNTKGTILFKYSKEGKIVVDEYEMPFRGAPKGVYNFFDKGILVYEKPNGKDVNYKLWFVENKDL